MTQKRSSDDNQNQKHAHGGGHDKGDMTVREAGELGGHKGGQRERELVEKGHQAEERGKGRH